MKTKKDLSDLVRIFQYLNKVDISRKPIIAEQVQKEKIIAESKQTEKIAMGILSTKGVDNVESIVNDFKEQDKTKNQILLPAMAYFFDGNVRFGDVFEKTIELLDRNMMNPPIVSKDGLKVGENVFTDFLKYGEFVHSTYDRKLGGSISTGSKSESDMTEDKPIFDKNGIKIFDANDKSKCIRYTQGGVTGKNYSFCIGQFTNNMYQSYRDTQTSTFYFLVDSNRDFKIDPLHIVVVDHTSNQGFLLTDSTNNTGTIAEYGQNVDEYFNYLKSKGVPVPEIFKHRPKSEQEKEEDRILGTEIRFLPRFIDLSYDYKSKYIGRGHRLTVEQFDYLWSDRNSRGTESLLKQYLNTGIPITPHQFKLIAGENKWMKTYWRQRHNGNFNGWENLKQANFNGWEILELDYAKKINDELAIVKMRPKEIQYIENPSEQVQLYAVSKDVSVIQYIENPSEQVQLEAIKISGYAIQFIENPSEQVQLAAVQDIGDAIEYIQNPSEQVQLAAVKESCWSIEYIQNPSEQVQLAAVQRCADAIEYIENPSKQVKQLARSKGFDI